MTIGQSAILAALDAAFSASSLEALGDGAAAELPDATWLQALQEPLKEFLGRPGKALRTEILEASFAVAIASTGFEQTLPTDLSLIIEAIHAGSLIVDDIEDDSHLRRGAPTLHRTYGLAQALNAGNWLYFWPFELLERIQIPEQQRLVAYRMITKVLRECHYGQALDLALRIEQFQPQALAPIALASSELKTGSLVGLAAGLGALLGGASEPTLNAIQRYGRAMGIALQMLDDFSSLLSIDKRYKVEEDLRLGRITWPWAWVAPKLDASLWSSLVEEVMRVRAGASAEPLVLRLLQLLDNRGPSIVEQHFALAWQELLKSIGDSSHLLQLSYFQDRLLNGFLSPAKCA